MEFRDNPYSPLESAPENLPKNRTRWRIIPAMLLGFKNV
jgi:hypothetical protein